MARLACIISTLLLLGLTLPAAAQSRIAGPSDLTIEALADGGWWVTWRQNSDAVRITFSVPNYVHVRPRHDLHGITLAPGRGWQPEDGMTIAETFADGTTRSYRFGGNSPNVVYLPVIIP